MIDFAVKVEGLDKDTDLCRWVLAVDPMGERLLVVHEDRSLHWHPMSECSFVKSTSPEAPIPVVPVKMESQPRLHVAGPNGPGALN